MAVTGTARIFGLLGSLVRTVASVIGGLIIVHAVFVLFGANSHNVLVQFTAGIRDSFGWFTKNLFQPSDKKMAEAINDALAGFIWVFLGSLVAKFIAQLAPASSGKDKSSKKNDDTPRSTPVQKSKPAEKPQEAKQEAPQQEAPKQEASKQEEPEQEAPKEAAAPRPEPESEPGPEAEADSSAKHQAKNTARDDERAEDKAEA
jgi:outer membrane biosynthesis protein TonB